jgi:hypothetical protein
MKREGCHKSPVPPEDRSIFSGLQALGDAGEVFHFGVGQEPGGDITAHEYRGLVQPGIGRYFSSGEPNRQDGPTASGYLTADLWLRGEGGRTCLGLRFGIGGKRLISKSPISVSGRPICCLKLA